MESREEGQATDSAPAPVRLTPLSDRAKQVFSSREEVAGAANTDLGASRWVLIDQERVDRFAAATGDHQWIHVDVERARSGPFGGTIAHGYLTLSLIPALSAEVFTLATPGARLNYGVNKVRFPAPLLVGKRVRLRAGFGAVSDVPAGTQLVVRSTIEVEDGDKPACVAETIVLLTP